MEDVGRGRADSKRLVRAATVERRRPDTVRQPNDHRARRGSLRKPERNAVGRHGQRRGGLEDDARRVARGASGARRSWRRRSIRAFLGRGTATACPGAACTTEISRSPPQRFDERSRSCHVDVAPSCTEVAREDEHVARGVPQLVATVDRRHVLPEDEGRPCASGQRTRVQRIGVGRVRRDTAGRLEPVAS